MKDTTKPTKWHLDNHKPVAQTLVQHCVAEKSDIVGPVAYKTASGKLCILKEYHRGYGFVPLETLLSVSTSEKAPSFFGKSRNEAVENALKNSRHVYSFAYPEELMKRHAIMMFGNTNKPVKL
jgi:acetylornithine/succinyldiaminopimelate/putrescine aminotransferase